MTKTTTQYLLDGKPVDDLSGISGELKIIVTTTITPNVVSPKPTPQPPDGIVIKPAKDIAVAVASAKPGDTIYLSGTYFGVKSIKVTTPGLTITSIAPTLIQFDPQNEKDAALFVLNGVEGFSLSDITVAGRAKEDAASYVVRCEGAKYVNLFKIKTVYRPTGGPGIVFVRGVDGLNVDWCSTEQTTVYSFYASAPGGALINQNINVRNCKWGPSGSHNMRCYGVKNLIIADCEFSNPKSPSGRQCIKVMNGENVAILRTNFYGTTRFGRDVNDPDTYTLKNCVIQDSGFWDWTRVDPTGGNVVTYSKCAFLVTSDSFAFHLFDKTSLENVVVEYPGGKLSNNPKNIVSMKNVTFNGVVVK